MWSLALREEHKLQVTKNKVLKKIYRPMRNEVNKLGYQTMRNFVIYTYDLELMQ